MGLPETVDMSKRPEVMFGEDAIAIMRTPSSSREGKHHVTVFYKRDGHYWFDCSCEGFQYTEDCRHCGDLHMRLENEGLFRT